MGHTTIDRKISPATVMGRDRVAPKPGEKEWWYRVAGVCTGYKEVPTNYGPAIKLIGEFQATRFDNGELFTAFSCYIPAGIADMLASRLNSLEEGSETQLDFVFDIGAEFDPKTKDNEPPKYRYIIGSPRDTGAGSAVRALLTGYGMPPGVKELPPGPLFENAKQLPGNK